MQEPANLGALPKPGKFVREEAPHMFDRRASALGQRSDRALSSGRILVFSFSKRAH
jgi:hypothetical protein